MASWITDRSTSTELLECSLDCRAVFRPLLATFHVEHELGPVLSLVFINDIDDAFTVELFADDAKLYTVISNESSAASLQSFLVLTLAAKTLTF